MSDLGYLERLLDGAAVEWVPLGAVADFLNGRAYKQQELLDEGKYPVLRVGNFFTNNSWYFSDLELEEDKYCDNGDLLYAWSASFGPRIWEGEKVIYHYHIWKVVPNPALTLKKFLYYLLAWDTEAIKGEQAAGSTMLHITKGAIEQRLVPIPCPDDPQKSLAIQAEIVRILDALTALTAELTSELTAELTARKTQYNHYRNQLFSFNGTDVEWRTLGDSRVGAFTRGGGLQKKDLTDHGVPCIHYGQIYTYYGTYAEKTKSYVTEDFASKARKAKPGDLVIATTSENDEDVCKAVAWLGAEDVVVSSDACFFTHHLNPKYVSYFLQTEHFQKQKRAHITGTKVRRVNADDLAKILIPIPFPDDRAKSLAEQERIANILDKFDTITVSLSEGLPREIALRKRQYEHYRNLLLGFPKGDQA